MIKNRWLGLCVILLMLAAVAGVWLIVSYPSLLNFTRIAAPYEAAFNKNQILQVDIAVDPEDWASMLENAMDKNYIPADITINGETLKQVGIRTKGNSSLSMVAQNEESDRYSFKLEFDHYISDQTWLGLDKLVVNNIQGDTTYMKEYLSYDIFNYLGVATPMYAYTDISVNGQKWGFYLAIEVLEESYLERNFAGQGMLYKPESMAMGGRNPGNNQEGAMRPPEGGEVNAADPNNNANFRGFGGGAPGFGGVEQNRPDPNNPNPVGEVGREPGGFGGMAQNGVSLQYIDDQSASYSAIFENAVFKAHEADYQRVIQALKNLGQRTDLAESLWIDQVIRYFAAHNTVVNLDSYSSNMGHNYYLYEHQGKISILPWDYNLSFGGFQSGGASEVINFPIDTPVSGVSLADRPLVGFIFDDPQYQDLYHQYLQELVDGYFNSGRYSQTIADLEHLIAEYVQADPSAFTTYEQFQSGVPMLRELGLRRAQSIAGQLAGTIPATTEGQKANPETLVSAEGVQLDALGSMMGGGRGGEGRGAPGAFFGFEGLDQGQLGAIMEIFRSNSESGLSAEQKTQLQELGLTEEQIAAFSERQMFQPGLNNGQGRGRPDEQPASRDSAPESPALSQRDWIILAGALGLLLLGVILAYRYQRRKTPKA